MDSVCESPNTMPSSSGYDTDSDLVSLKISLLDDCQTGKTSFLVKYVGDEEEKISLRMKGLNVMDKLISIQGARIAFRIWDVGGATISTSNLVTKGTTYAAATTKGISGTSPAQIIPEIRNPVGTFVAPPQKKLIQ